MTLSEIIDKAEENMIHHQSERDVLRGYLRYESIRRLNPRQFRELWSRNISTGTPFDELVDELVVKDHTP